MARAKPFPVPFLILVHSTHIYLPMKMEQTKCSETSTYKLQTPGNYLKESIQHTEHGESLKSRITSCFFTVALPIFVNCEMCVTEQRAQNSVTYNLSLEFLSGLHEHRFFYLKSNPHLNVIYAVTKFNILLTVHLGTIVVNNQIDALYLMYLFISLFLYLSFRTS